jgi:hypothetical protein
MRIYLDNSVLNRPFDDQGQPRIWFETVAFIQILTLIEANEVSLVWSSVIDFERIRGVRRESARSGFGRVGV